MKRPTEREEKNVCGGRREKKEKFWAVLGEGGLGEGGLGGGLSREREGSGMGCRRAPGFGVQVSRV